MDTEDGGVDDLGLARGLERSAITTTHSCEIQVVEDVTACSPYARVAVLLHALVVETVHLCDLARLVVAAKEGDALGVAAVRGAREGVTLGMLSMTVPHCSCDNDP